MWRFVTDLAVSILCFALMSRSSIAGPVGARKSPLRLTETCSALARSLLWNVSAVLERVNIIQLTSTYSQYTQTHTQVALSLICIIFLQDHLFSGFDCAQQNAEVHLRTQTVSACIPQVSESHKKWYDGIIFQRWNISLHISGQGIRLYSRMTCPLKRERKRDFIKIQVVFKNIHNFYSFLPWVVQIVQRCDK